MIKLMAALRLNHSQLPQVASQGTHTPAEAKMFIRLHWPLLARKLKQEGTTQ